MRRAHRAPSGRPGTHLRPFLSALAAALLFAAACSPFVEPNSRVLREAMGIDVTPAQVGDTPPQVSYSAEVLLSRAEGYYQDRRFADAADTYARFMELHAAHRWAPYALYMEGMSYVHQIRTDDRDPSFAQKARQAFENLIANYPDSDPVSYAKDELKVTLDRLASHELGIARFYLRTHLPEAAKTRLEQLRKDYPDTPSADAALFDLGRALEATGDPAGAADAYRQYLASTPESESDGFKRKAEEALGRLTGG
jgi:outer membrane assembly lipoprotein YfiO